VNQDTPTLNAIRYAIAAARTRIQALAHPDEAGSYRMVANAQSRLAANALADVMADNDLGPDDDAEAAA
jgi:hypothetical protein